MAETIHLRGEGGGIHEFDLPLDDRFQTRLYRGEMVRVNPDGSPWVDQPEPVTLTPKQKLQAEAAELGLDTGGTSADIEARISEHRAKLADLQKQAAELELDTEGSIDEIEERIVAKLSEPLVDAKLAE